MSPKQERTSPFRYGEALKTPYGNCLDLARYIYPYPPDYNFINRITPRIPLDAYLKAVAYPRIGSKALFNVLRQFTNFANGLPASYTSPVLALNILCEPNSLRVKGDFADSRISVSPGLIGNVFVQRLLCTKDGSGVQFLAEGVGLSAPSGAKFRYDYTETPGELVKFNLDKTGVLSTTVDDNVVCWNTLSPFPTRTTTLQQVVGEPRPTTKEFMTLDGLTAYFNTNVYVQESRALSGYPGYPDSEGGRYDTARMQGFGRMLALMDLINAEGALYQPTTYST